MSADKYESKQAGNESGSTAAGASPISGTRRLSVPKTYKLYVDGKFPRTESGRYFAYEFKSGDGSANLCNSSRKDFRDAATVARAAVGKWSGTTAYNRGQILYRIAEMLEGRRGQFIEELLQQGSTRSEAESEVSAAIDRLVYYAGWADKYQQVFSSVNPVAASYFNFSMLEPTGVVTILAPEESSLLGLVSVIAPVIVGGNTCVVLASSAKPLCAITFAEVLQSSDVPGGVVNLLTGFRRELIGHMTSHMDINAVVYCGTDGEEIKTVQTHAALNIKRAQILEQWNTENPYLILETQEVKTTWHPVGI
jgi:acyl-CoA reductase-like NAD-dependent aldehyde dehydrogenase